jgi:hypothetical protein
MRRVPVPVCVVPLFLLFALSCRPAPSAADRLWAAMQPLCGQAFAGRVIEGTEPADEAMPIDSSET